MTEMVITYCANCNTCNSSPLLVGYVNSGLHPQGRRQSTMAICCVGVSGLQSSGMRKELVVVVVVTPDVLSSSRNVHRMHVAWIIFCLRQILRR